MRRVLVGMLFSVLWLPSVVAQVRAVAPANLQPNHLYSPAVDAGD